MTDTTIKAVLARRVWDSRGRPTVEAEVHLAGGARGRAIAPAGASRGSREALDLRDGGQRLAGMDIRLALAGITDRIAPLLLGRDAADQPGCDGAMIALDGTALKSSLGGNAMVACSLALVHAVAAAQDQPLWAHLAQVYGHVPSLPLPEVQIFGGGAHAGRRTDVQDFMVMVPGARNLDEVMEVTSEIYIAAGSLMAAKGRQSGVADEGGWWPDFKSNEEALETLIRAVELAGEKPGDRVVLSLDIAASEFGKDGLYRMALDRRSLDADQMADLLGGWIADYFIASIEDPLAEDDPAGMQHFTGRFGDRVQIVGDDYLVTDAGLIGVAAVDRACNAALIKVNQAGTLTETIAALTAAERAGWGRIVSARSGETEDVSISHLAVGLGAGQLKVGSITRSERLAKWNELLRIGEDMRAGGFVGGRPLAATWWGKKQRS
jgi:enolase